MMIHSQKMNDIKLGLDLIKQRTDESVKEFNEYIKRALDVFNLNYQYQRN